MSKNELLEKAITTIQMNAKIKDKYLEQENYDMYGNVLCVITSQIELLHQMGLIAFKTYEELINEYCYKLEE